MEYLLYFNRFLLVVLGSLFIYAMLNRSKGRIFGGVGDAILMLFLVFSKHILATLAVLWLVYFIFR